jgi:hypothetical protein
MYSNCSNHYLMICMCKFTDEKDIKKKKKKDKCSSVSR